MAAGGVSDLDTGGVVAGFFSFTEITEPSAHRAYNEWHQLDHLPEQITITGIAHGERWVATPTCRAVRYPPPSTTEAPTEPSDLSIAHYLTLYLMRDPLEETLQSFYELAARLHREDRFFPHRRALATGPLGVLGAFAAPRVRVSAAAVPYRPNRGVFVVVEAPKGAEHRSPSARLAAAEVLLGVPGVAGVWFFGPAGATGQGDDGARDGPVPAPGAGGDRFEADVTMCFLDGDPVSVVEDIVELLAPGWEPPGSAPLLAEPFETVVPWSWDWFG